MPSLFFAYVRWFMCTGDCFIKTCYGEAPSNWVLLIGISVIFVRLCYISKSQYTFSLVKKDKNKIK